MQEYERKFEQLSEYQKLSKLCSDAGLKLVEQGQYFYTLDTKEGQQVQHLCREYTLPRNVTLTSVSIPVRERKWIDIETQRSHDQKCYEMSKAITRLLRHDQTVPRGIDGAFQYNDIIEEFDGASQWSLEDWTSTLAK